MKKYIAILLLIVGSAFAANAQTQPIEMPKGYRFQHRIKGPEYKHSEVLELMVDSYGNYLVATFRGEKSSFVYLIVYNLYTWDEQYKIKLNDNRCELYNSFFDENGEYLYVNYDIYRNKYKEINLKTKEIRELSCDQTPRGCIKIEPQLYRVDAYTIGDIYFICRDDNFLNYIKVFVKRELYIPKDVDKSVTPEKGGIIKLSPKEIRELEAGQEIVKEDIPIFYDPNSLDSLGNALPYTPDEFSAYKVRLTPNEMGKLRKKISFPYDKLVIKLDLDALEEEEN
ncbi:MAG: hypothetical protein MJ069_09250 [Salinivirgaceae bacterium]|nr:hypothetical protein [Salinivirgaceae bacterium]